MPRGSLLARNPRVMVLVPAAIGSGRGVIRGVAAYANRRGPWHLQVESDGDRRLPSPEWNGEGIIARITSPAMAATLRQFGVPIVNISAQTHGGQAATLPRVCTDLRKAAELAAGHLLERGFRHFAYVGLPRLKTVRNQEEAFAAAVARAGAEYRSHSLNESGWTVGRGSPLARWLQELPKPVGILTWANIQGRKVIETCRHIGLLVPEDVAVICGNDDPLLCGTYVTPLSAIAVADEEIGERAAEMLDDLIRGKAISPRQVFLPPLGIVTRQSTDTLAVHEPDLVQAIGFIREHATSGIRVDDILEVVPTSRRRLERLFKRQLGRSPADEIRRVRIERARHLLSSTDLPVPQVAESSGFATGEYLATIFKQATGMTPLKFRSATRSRG
jgi:LacI family transcriptional regulator